MIRPTSTRPMIARSSELTVVSTPAARINGPVAPKNSKVVSGSASRIAFTSDAACASPEGSPATIISRRVFIGGRIQEDRRRKTGGRRQEAGGRRQEAGGRRQEAEGRRQKAGKGHR